MSTPTATFQAGEGKDFVDLGDFFRVLAATAPLDVIFYHQGREVSRAEGIGLGYWEEFQNGERFDRVHVTSSGAQTIKLAMRFGSHVGYDIPPTGNVTLSGMQGAFTQARQNVDAVTVVQLLAANAARRRLMVQNNTGAQYLRVTLDGSAPTAANGFRLVPGDLLDIDGYLCTGAVKAIFESGAAAAVEYAEG